MLRWTIGAVCVAAVLLSGCRRSGSSGFFLPASSDSGALIVVDTVPRPNDQGVAVDRPIGVAFSALLDPSTVTSESFQVHQADAPIEGELTTRGREIFWRAPSALPEQARLEVVVSDSIRGRQGEALAETMRFAFRTGSAEPFEVARTLPADGARSVAPDVVVTVELTLDVDSSSIDGESLTVRRGAQVLPGSTRVEGSVLELRLDEPLLSETTYTATLAATIEAFDGRPLGEERVWSFTTRETVPPVIESVLPEPSSEDVDRRIEVEATFNEELASGTVDEASFILQRGSGVKVSASVAYADRRATLTPVSRLLPGEQYTARLSDHITDLAGNSLEPFQWSFVTAFDRVGPADLLEEDDTGDATEPRVAVVGEERALAVWTQDIASSAGGDDRRSIYSRHYDFTAGEWDPSGPVLLDRWEMFDCHSPRIARDPGSGDAIAVWLQEVEPGVLVWPMARRFDGALLQWEEAETQLPGTKEARAESLRIAFDGTGRALAVWIDTNKDAATLWARQYLGAAGGWDKPRVLSSSDTTATPRQPVVAGAPGGGFFVVWESVDSKGVSNLLWTRFGADWGKPEELETDDRQAYGASIAFTTLGDAHFIWHHNNTRDDADVPIADVRSRRWLVKTGEFETQEPLYIDVEDRSTAQSAVLATDADGGALVAWIQSVGDAEPRERVLARRFDVGDKSWGPATPWRLNEADAGPPSNLAIAQRPDGAGWVIWNEPGPKGPPNLLGAHFDVTAFWHESAFLQVDLGEESGPASIAVGIQGAAFVTWPETAGEVTSIWAVRFP